MEQLEQLERWNMIPSQLAASNFLSKAYPIMSATMRNNSSASWMKKCS